MIEIYTLDQSEKWDNIVCSFENHDVYWLSGYVKAFKIHGDGEPLLVYCVGEYARGMTVVMKRDIAFDTHFSGRIKEGVYYDFATPYGYGGWIIEGDQADDLFDAYSDWSKRNRVISEFVRFHPMTKNHESCKSHYEVIKLGEVVHIPLNDPESIWGNLTSKNRNVIRKAIKNSVRIYNGRFPEIYERFRGIYNATMDKDEAEKYYYFSSDFYSSICEDLPENAQVFWAEKDGIIIAASILLECNGFMNYHLSGSLREYNSLAATNLLLYKAALWGCAHGLNTLYLGGGVGSGEDSLYKFKRAFYKGDDLNHFFIGRKVFDLDAYRELMDIRGDGIENADFFPAYRG